MEEKILGMDGLLWYASENEILLGKHGLLWYARASISFENMRKQRVQAPVYSRNKQKNRTTKAAELMFTFVSNRNTNTIRIFL